ELGTAVAGVHARNGVDVRCNVQVAGLAVQADGSVEVSLGDGSALTADTVVVGIGVAPTLDWLADSGLQLGDGIRCDATLNVGVPGVYAAGDCTRWPNGAFVGDDGGAG
ncbi:MAG TPA: FAD-dependent oxidoreductase, partial [Acidimicrobiaceae bacterium]|nr:FAD-dependent oxidoreductase [Acidimicrobiaceae bacterium]